MAPRHGSLLPLFRAVVVGTAQRLPVVWIPEELVVTPVRFDVVHDGGRRHYAFALAENAQRMLSEVSGARSLPSSGVAALTSGTALSVEVTSLLGRRSMALGPMKR